MPFVAQSSQVILSDLINNINSNAVLKEQLSLYDGLIEGNNQYRIESLIPILSVRMRDIANANDTADKFRSETNNLLQQLSNNATQASALAAAINAVANAADHASQITELASLCFKQLKAFAVKLEDAFLAFMNQFFEETKTDVNGLGNNLEKLNELVSNKSYNDKWVKEQIDNSLVEILTYKKELSLTDIKNQIHLNCELLQKLIPTVDELSNTILKRKASNPLVSDELVSETTKLFKDIQKLNTDFTSFINNLYLFDELNSTLIDTIDNYHLLGSKLNITEEKKISLVH